MKRKTYNCRDIGHVYDNYYIPMIKPDKGDDNYNQLFFNFQQKSGKPMDIASIGEDIKSYHQHIMEQERIIKEHFETYKGFLCKIAIYDYVKTLIGGNSNLRGI